MAWHFVLPSPSRERGWGWGWNAAVDELVPNYGVSPSPQPSPIQEREHVGELEETHVETIVASRWRLRRLRAVEKGIFEAKSRDYGALGMVFRSDSVCDNAFTKLSRYETAIDRAMHRALRELQRMQAERKAEKAKVDACHPELDSGSPACENTHFCETDPNIDPSHEEEARPPVATGDARVSGRPDEPTHFCETNPNIDPPLEGQTRPPVTVDDAHVPSTPPDEPPHFCETKPNNPLADSPFHGWL